MSSPGLRAPINSQPYGFQLWVLADVRPTHRSIWRAGEGEDGRFLVSPFGSCGDFSQILIMSLHQVDWCFPQRWNYGTMWLLFCTWKRSQSPAVTHGSRRHCLSIKTCAQTGWTRGGGGLYSRPVMKFSPQMNKMNLKNIWRNSYRSSLPNCQM